jgi:tRNA(fMet)-specific endonuclease VapC
VTTTFLLDTNTVSYIAKGISQAARTRLTQLGAGDVVSISSITEAELRYGMARRPAAHALHAAIHTFLLKVKILPWRSEEAEAYGAMRAALEAAGKTIAAMDLLIAAHAASVNAVLVTNDKAFENLLPLPLKLSPAAIVNWATDL